MDYLPDMLTVRTTLSGLGDSDAMTVFVSELRDT